MGKYQLTERPKTQVLIGVVALAADNTPAALDTRDYNCVEIELDIGIGGITFDGSNKVEFKLTHSDDDSSYAAVETGDVRAEGAALTVASGGIIKSLVAAHAAAARYHFEYIGAKRYLKLLADFTGTHGTATPMCAVARMTHGRLTPPI